MDKTCLWFMEIILYNFNNVNHPFYCVVMAATLNAERSIIDNVNGNGMTALLIQQKTQGG